MNYNQNHIPAVLFETNMALHTSIFLSSKLYPKLKQVIIVKGEDDEKDEIEVGVSAALLNFLNHPQRK